MSSSTMMIAVCRLLARRSHPIIRQQQQGVIATTTTTSSRLDGWRCFSTTPNDGQQEQPPKLHHQSFVTQRILAGEWDDHRTDPLYRPKFPTNQRTKVMSKEDWANRPRVTFYERYDSYEDAGMTLSWMTQEDFKTIYELYITWMIHAQERFGKTSHEYVTRLIAQKYNITAFRVAAIIQLEHNEQRIKEQIQEEQQQYHQKLQQMQSSQKQTKNDDEEKAEDGEGDEDSNDGDSDDANNSDNELSPPVDWLLPDEMVEALDEAMKRCIHESYAHTREPKPTTFMEPALAFFGNQEDKRYASVDDVFDLDSITRDAIMREQNEAQLMIDGHTYIQDVDEDDIPIPMSKKSQDLIKAKETIEREADSYKRVDPLLARENFKIEWPTKKVETNDEDEDYDEDEDTEESEEATMTAAAEEKSYKPTKHHEIPNKYMTKRPRWKYAAQVVDIHDIQMQIHEEKLAAKEKIVGIKKAKKLSVGYENNCPENTIIEVADDDENNKMTLRRASLKEVKKVAWKPIRNVQEHTYAGVKEAWLDRTVRNKQGVWGRKNIYQGLL